MTKFFRREMRLPLVLTCGLAVLMCALMWQGLRRPGVAELTEYVGKTEADVRKKFGFPTSEALTDYGWPDPGASAAETEQFWQQTTVRVLFYGDVEVHVNIHGRIASVHHKP